MKCSNDDFHSHCLNTKNSTQTQTRTYGLRALINRSIIPSTPVELRITINIHMDTAKEQQARSTWKLDRAMGKASSMRTSHMLEASEIGGARLVLPGR